MKKTTAQHILKYLNDKGWTSSVFIDREVAHMASKKEATVSRAARLLAEEGKLEKKIEGKVVWYKIAEGARKKKEVVTYLPNGSVKIELV